MSEETADAAAPGPLDGVRVLDLTTGVAGPASTQMLAFLGAEVIWIHSEFQHRRRIANDDPSVNVMQLGKRSARLNLRDPRGLDLARRLVAHCDVVVENQRPGAVEKLGLGYEALREIRPDIIGVTLSTSGYGGPERDVGYAPTFVARSGLGALSGYEGGPPAEYVNWPDFLSAHWLVFGVFYALLHRNQTGEGQWIDLSATESLTTLIGDQLMDVAMNGRNLGPRGNHDALLVPNEVYRCANGWISIAVAGHEEWEALCRVMERPDLASEERFASRDARKEHESALDELIGEWTAGQERMELVGRLQAAGVAAAPVLNGEDLIQDPHIGARGGWVTVEHPVLGPRTAMAPPWSFSATPATVSASGPLEGQHEGYVYGELLGLSEEEIEQLREADVIR